MRKLGQLECIAIDYRYGLHNGIDNTCLKAFVDSIRTAIEKPNRSLQIIIVVLGGGSEGVREGIAIVCHIL